MIPHFGPGFFFREPTDAERIKDAAVQSVMQWFDLEQAAKGLRSFYRYDRFREERAEAMKANPPKFARWWNR